MLTNLKFENLFFISTLPKKLAIGLKQLLKISSDLKSIPVSYTHLRAHETGRNLVCRLLLEKKLHYGLRRFRNGKTRSP